MSAFAVEPVFTQLQALAFAGRQRLDVALLELGQIDGGQRRAHDPGVVAGLPAPAVEVRMPPDQGRFKHR